jgi:hypothetical protein
MWLSGALRLRDAMPLNKLQCHGHLDRQAGHAYTRDEYLRITSASTEEMITAPHAVAERLVAPLSRALGVASLYPPSKR